MTKVCIGKIVNTHGLKGEVKIQSYSDFDEVRYQKGNIVYILEENEYIPLTVNSFRFHKGNPHVSFKDHEDINLIERYKGCEVYVESTDRQPLEGEYYQSDLIGLSAFDEEGNYLGSVKSVEPTGGAQNNLRIAMEDHTFLVPFIPEFIKNVDLENHKIMIHMEEGLK